MHFKIKPKLLCSFLAIIICLFSNSNASSPSCAFKGCECSGSKRDFTIVCSKSSTKTFPLRDENFNASINIYKLFFNDYDLDKIPDDIFSGLYIQQLFFNLNSLNTLTANALRGIRYINRLVINGPLGKMQKDAFIHVRDILFWLDLRRTFTNPNKFVAFLEEIKQLRILGTFYVTESSLQSFKKEWLRPFPELLVLDLSDNNLETLDEDLFEYTPILQRLAVRNNKFTNLDVIVRALRGLNMSGIEVSDNQIRTVRAHHFASFSQLYYLNLTNNLIDNIEQNAFARNKELTVLFLQKNRLRSLPSVKIMPNLGLYDFRDQNGQLVALRDFEFFRNNSNLLFLLMDDNYNTRYSNRFLCSRGNIQYLSIDYWTFASLNRCIFTQTYQFNETPLVLFLNKGARTISESAVCNCRNKLFFEKYKISIERDRTSVMLKFNA
jgi:Leucine-rich repeat (LRR) protein